MPINKYFGGSGDKVMASMQKTYPDPTKAKSVFYATANKQGQTPDTKPKRKSGFTFPAKKKSD